MFVAPTEPPELRAIAQTVSMFPETMGADIAILPHQNFGKGWIGVQRKEVADLFASIQDGRLGQQIVQMSNACLMSVLVIEGQIRWTNEGEAFNAWGKKVISRSGLDSLLWTIRSTGVHVDFTKNLTETIAYCEHLEGWAKKPEHTPLASRPGPTGDAWGRVSNRDWARHLLMGFKGVGHKTAEAIIEHFGDVPLAWVVTEKDLMGVPGVGKVRAKEMIQALEGKPE